MTPRFGIPAVLLLIAAAGWVLFPPRPAGEPDATDLAVRQLGDDGTVAPALDARHRAGADWIPPVACLALTAAAVAAGVREAYRRKTASEKP